MRGGREEEEGEQDMERGAWVLEGKENVRRSNKGNREGKVMK